MHARTKKLHALMTRHNLKAQDVADILGVSAQTVRVWRTDADSQNIPAIRLAVLALVLAMRDDEGGAIAGELDAFTAAARTACEHMGVSDAQLRAWGRDDGERGGYSPAFVLAHALAANRSVNGGN